MSITRRLLLHQSATASAVLATITTPVAAEAVEPERPWVKARRLARELSETLAECDDGTMMAEVYPLKDGRPPYFFVDIEWLQDTAQNRLNYHAQAYGRAAKELDPTATVLLMGRGVGDNPQRFSLIVARTG